MAKNEKVKRTKLPGGHMLKAWREGMGYSVADAAKELGMNEADITNMEASDDMPPRYIRLAMAALGLGMAPEGDGPSPADSGEA